MTDRPPAPDQIDGAPHPRETPVLLGHEATERSFLQAYGAGRLHHGWLITGARGVGKATLAWRIARFLLATPPAGEDGLFGAPPVPDTLDIPAGHPVARRLLAGSDPGLFLLRRGGQGSREGDQQENFEAGKFSQVIRVDEVRHLARFINLSAVDGGRRVVIVDAADEMNQNAANALLKMLEEPPARTTLLLIAHQPARLLPTIRSRCRELRMGRLGPDQIGSALAQAGITPPANPAALAELAAGSVGEAVRLINLDGLTLYADLLAIVGSLPRLDRARALKLADSMAARGADARFDLLVHLCDVLLSRLVRCGAMSAPPATEAAPGEAEILQRLAPNPATARVWADAAHQISGRIRQGKAVNLDPAALVLDMVFRMQKTA